MATKQKTGNLIDRLKWVLSLSVFTLAIVGNSYYSATPFLYRVLGVVGLFILGLVILALTDFGSNASKLMRESRTELRRVVWPSRPETTQTFLIVFGSIVVLCLVFWGLESLLSWLTKLVLG